MNLLELAKQGDAKAIEALINRSLKPKGISAKAALKDGCLQIMLESAQVPNQQALVAFIRKEIISLGAESIKTVKVYGRQTGEEIPTWSHEFEVALTENNVSLEMNVIKSNPGGSKSAPATNENKTSKEPQNNINTSSRNQKVSEAKPLVNQSVKTSSASPYQKLKDFRQNKYLLSSKLLPLLVLPIGIATIILGFKIFGPSPEGTVKNFLSALNKGDDNTALEYWCYQKGSVLYAVQSWESLRKETKQADDFSTSNLADYYPEIKPQVKDISKTKYTAVVFRVKSSNKGGMPITQDWNFTVWQTKDKVNYTKKIEEFRNLINKKVDEEASSQDSILGRIDAVGAYVKFVNSTMKEFQNVDKASSHSYCIASIEEQ